MHAPAASDTLVTLEKGCLKFLYPSNLDVKSEATILTNLRAKNITTLLISHRPDVCKFADRVLEMDDLCRPELSRENKIVPLAAQMREYPWVL